MPGNDVPRLDTCVDAKITELLALARGNLIGAR